MRTVFLDRDGVLNEKAPEGEYIWRRQDFRVLEGVPEAIACLNRAGLRVVVATNQRGVALGRYSLADVHALHADFQKRLAERGAHIDAFYVCPHGGGDCNCRKPLPGLFQQAVAEFPEIDAETSVMVGDSRIDIEFARGTGMRAILVEAGAENRAPGSEKAAELADLRCSSLREAVEAILNQGSLDHN